MKKSKNSPLLRVATPDDAMSITILYQQVYNGNYSNPLMRDTNLLISFLNSPENIWVIAELELSDEQGHHPISRIVGSVVYETDPVHRLAKAFGGAVLAECRGMGLLEKAMIFAQDHMMNSLQTVDVIYATTRTSSPAPQIVTEHLGFKKLGIFPNVHRTDVFETHCLTAFFSQEALWGRFLDFKMHPKLQNLYNIVRSECNLASIEIAQSEDLKLDHYNDPIELELISAEKYAKYRYNQQKNDGLLQAHFFPFHEPNVVVSSPCQKVEIFCYLAPSDKHCTIMGVKKPREFDFTEILETTVKLLNAGGARYIEILVRADKAKTIERVMKARFIPCAYFPAFQSNNHKRYDFAVFSRTFEVLDFTYLKLAGKNRIFLDEYIRNLQDFFLKPQSMES